MSKKEELIERIAIRIENLESENATEFTTKLYDEIRASILTPKAVALLKAIGSKPNCCDDCRRKREDGNENPFCGLTYTNIHDGYLKCMDDCPILTSEELKELTE